MKTIVIDGVEYELVPKEQPDEPLICTLDGVRYFLGPQASKKMTWQEADDWCKSLGPDYELPSQQVLLMCYVYSGIASKFFEDYYWSSSEYGAMYAYYQSFFNGLQYCDSKLRLNYVRAVRRVLV